MKRITRDRLLAAVLAISIIASLAGCGTNVTPTPTQPIQPTPSSSQAVPDSDESTTTPDNTSPPSEGATPGSDETTTTPDNTSPPSEDVTQPDNTTPEGAEQTEVIPSNPVTPPENNPPEPETDEYGLTEQQRNSYSMLYYLAIIAEEIRLSKDNSLVLDDIYTSLFNDINPGAIDETTQTHLENLRNVIEQYIDTSTKRQRLQYLYNQEKASSIRSAVPNPLNILSMTNSLNWKKMAVSVVYTVVDSYNNYQSANEAADQEFLMNGWELDDEVTDAMRKNRKRAFNYMVDIVQEYGLDGKLTLNEEAITLFAEICEIQSMQEKISRLEAEDETYKLLGNYWLELADCYYETSQYKKCLDCVETYNKLSTGIYRKDYNYVQILPKAIVAAQKTNTGDDYVAAVGAFADDIISNTNTTDWSVRYFAAQVYLDLYMKTDDQSYLEKAYEIAYSNVTVLLSEQRKLNETYLAEVKEVEIKEPDYKYLTEAQKAEKEKQFKEEKARLKEYNKTLKETRQTELPPLYEPLILNCDFLFAIAAEMNISFSEKSKIEDILQTKTNGIFISKAVNDRYKFSTANSSKYSIEFDGDEVVIPASLLSTGANLIVTVSANGKNTEFEDFKIDKVERKGTDVDTFKAYYSSKQMKDFKWSENAKVTVEIYNGENYAPITLKFKVVEYKDNWVIADKVVFEKA